MSDQIETKAIVDQLRVAPAPMVYHKLAADRLTELERKLESAKQALEAADAMFDDLDKQRREAEAENERLLAMISGALRISPLWRPDASGEFDEAEAAALCSMYEQFKSVGGE